MGTLIANDEYQPVPWDPDSALPELIAGGHGRLRHEGQSLIDARTDLEAVGVWLDQKATNPNTRELYQAQAERLLLWASIERGKALSDLTVEDYQEFEKFLANPKPKKRWVGPRRPRQSPDWRPFTGPLAPDSRRTVMTVLNSLLNFLVAARYLAGNPIALTRRRAPARDGGVQRFLDEPTWAAVMETVEGMPREDWRDRARYERARWVLSLLYLALPRRSEIVAHRHGDIRRIRREGEARWWWYLTGKGGKQARVPVSDELVQALARYRDSLGLAPYPAPDDETPMVCRLPRRHGMGTPGPITSNMLYRLVKDLFRAAAERVEPDHPEMADTLRHASTHWVRHTGVTRLLDRGEALHRAQRLARHAKLDTTGDYAHAADRELHEAAARHRLGWPGAAQEPPNRRESKKKRRQW